MRCRTGATLLVGFALVAGCALHEQYPPAYPSTRRVPWDNSPLVAVTPPPPELAYQPPRATRQPLPVRLPPVEEWLLWRMQPATKTVCRGKGKQRRCRQEAVSPVEQANAGALVRPNALHTQMGTSGQVRYPLDLSRDRIYEVQTSPGEATYLLLPEGERLAAKLLLNVQEWEVAYGKNGAEGSRREVVVLRPVQAPQTGRGVLVFQSGLAIYLKLLAHERPGMLSVAWELPERPMPAPELPPDQRPPQFDNEAAYAGYTMTLEGKTKLPPPWYPEAVLDDGRNTLIKFRDTLDGIRLPVVQGIQQNGMPALVQSRLYVREDHGAWLYVQGLWPALQLKDGAGQRVKMMRQVPLATAEPHHGY